MGHAPACSSSHSPPHSHRRHPSSLAHCPPRWCIVQLPPFPEAANVVGADGDGQGDKGKTGGTGEQCEKGEAANGGALETGHTQACHSSNPTHAIILIPHLIPALHAVETYRYPMPPPPINSVCENTLRKNSLCEHFCANHVGCCLCVLAVLLLFVLLFCVGCVFD